MHILEFNVQKQLISHNRCRPLIADSVGHVYARFTLDDEWTGLAVAAVFENTAAAEPVSVPLSADIIEVPSEVLIDGHLSVSLVGLAEEGKTRLPTAQMTIPIKVYRAGHLIGVDPQQHTPEIWEQLLALIGPVSHLDTEDRSSLVAAINEVLRRGGSGNGSGELPDDIERTTNRVTVIDGMSDDEHYPTAKAVYAVVGNIETALDRIIAVQESYIAQSPVPVNEEVEE